MPYRDVQPVKIDPRFSYIEKCFVDGTRTKRFVGHALMLSKNIGKLLAGTLLGTILCTAIASAFWLLAKLSAFLGHLINLETEGGFLILIALVVILFCIVKLIIHQIEYNAKRVNYRINEKIKLSETPLLAISTDTDSDLFYNRCMSEVESVKKEINERVSNC